MSNTLTNVKDIKVAQKALTPFTANLMPVTSFSTNFGPQPSDKGDTVRVPLIGAPSGSSDFAGDRRDEPPADRRETRDRETKRRQCPGGVRLSDMPPFTDA